MMLNIRHFLLFLSLFYIVPNAFGQDEKKSIELKKILDDIALQHNVKFSYLEEDVFGHSIFPPPKSLPLKAKLVYIANRTLLSYKETGNYIVIFSGPKQDTKRLCAYVIDELGYPVDNAVIQYTPDSKKIVTSHDGYFELPRNITGSLYIDHLNYEPISVRISDFTDDCKEIVLKLEVVNLDEVVAEL